MTQIDKVVVPVRTSTAPSPAGHYEQGVQWDGLVFVSGQLPVRPDGTHGVEASIDDQVRQALANVLAVARAAGAEARDVLKVTAYIVGVENWPTFNSVYSEVFGEFRPARTVVPVPALHHGYLVEIEAIAVRR